jgi:hypothetical protein
VLDVQLAAIEKDLAAANEALTKQKAQVETGKETPKKVVKAVSAAASVRALLSSLTTRTFGLCRSPISRSRSRA